MIEKDKIILPSPDFQRLCLEQLDLFRRIVDPNAVLSVRLSLSLFFLFNPLKDYKVFFNLFFFYWFLGLCKTSW